MKLKVQTISFLNFDVNFYLHTQNIGELYINILVYKLLCLNLENTFLSYSVGLSPEGQLSSLRTFYWRLDGKVQDHDFS